MRTVVSSLTGIVCALALFLVMHYLVNDDRPLPQSPIVDRWELPVREPPPEEEPRLKERHKPDPPPDQPPRLVQASITAPTPQSVPDFPDMQIPAIPGPDGGTYFPPPGRNTGPDRDVACSIRVAPQYPTAQRAAGVEGFVEVQFTVLPDGRVTDAVVVDSDPPRVFDRAVLRAVNRWRCEPSVSGGAAVSRRASSVLQFRIEP